MEADPPARRGSEGGDRHDDTRASDIDYFYTSRLPGEPAGGIADVHFHPAEPRAARLTLKWRP